MKKSDFPLVSLKRIRPKPSQVYDTYWRFAAERQNVFFKKFQGALAPWTDDEVLKKYKFTNVYRASDRVSQYLITNIIYNSEYSIEDLFYRIILFKTFNKIETWQLLEKKIQEDIVYGTYSFDKIDRILSEKMECREPIYSAAYIMASGKNAFGYFKKHQNHLRLLELMMIDDIPQKIAHAKKMKEVYELLISYSTIGSFLAYQYCIDLNYSPLTNFSEMEFVIPGPGAKSGIKKCFESLGEYDASNIIAYMADRQEEEFYRLGIDFKTLWGRRLQLIDCQNLFCEVDKYSRIVHPEVQGSSNRTKIKQLYRPSSGNVEYWFPPKWNINDNLGKKSR